MAKWSINYLGICMKRTGKDRLIITSHQPYAVWVSEDERSLLLEPIYAWGISDEDGKLIGFCADEAGLFPCTELTDFVGVAASKDEALRKYAVCARKAVATQVVVS